MTNERVAHDVRRACLLFGYTVHCIHVYNTIHGSFFILSRRLGYDTVKVYIGDNHAHYTPFDRLTKQT